MSWSSIGPGNASVERPFNTVPVLQQPTQQPQQPQQAQPLPPFAPLTWPANYTVDWSGSSLAQNPYNPYPAASASLSTQQFQPPQQIQAQAPAAPTTTTAQCRNCDVRAPSVTGTDTNNKLFLTKVIGFSSIAALLLVIVILLSLLLGRLSRR